LYAAQSVTIMMVKGTANYRLRQKRSFFFFLNDSILGFDIMLEQFTLTFLMNILIPSSGLLNNIQVHTEEIYSQTNTDV